MPTKRTVLVTALLALLVTTSGCSALTGGSDVDAEQVLDRTQEGMSDLETFTFDAQMTMSSEQAEEAQNVTASGAVDLPAAEGRAEVDGPAQSLQMYVVDETMYMNLQGTWVQQDLSNATDQAGPQPTMTPDPELFENATSVSFEGNSTVDGTDVYEIAMDVDEEQLLDATGQEAMAGMGSLEDVSATLYVSHGEYRLKQVDLDVTASVQGQETDADVRITLDDFNEDVTIDLPEEAENAQPMGMG